MEANVIKKMILLSVFVLLPVSSFAMNANDPELLAWEKTLRENPAAFVQTLEKEGAFYDALPEMADLKVLGARVPVTQSMLAYALEMKPPKVSHERRITAIVKLLAKGYRVRGFVGVEPIMEDYKRHRALYDKKISAIPNEKARKVIRETVNVFLLPDNGG